LVPLLLIFGCPPHPGNGGGSGGITITQTDTSPPSLSLGSGQQNGQDVSVKSGGNGIKMTLIRKTGPLNLLVTGNDPESGIQKLEIWINKSTTTCATGGSCTNAGPGLLGNPAFEMVSPPKNPGDMTSESATMLQAFDLSAEIPQGNVSQGTRTVVFTIYAVAVNHLGGKVQTPEIAVTWKEP
jgi:hypothetical protein